MIFDGGGSTATTSISKSSVLPASGWLRSSFTTASAISTTMARNSPSGPEARTVAPTLRSGIWAKASFGAVMTICGSASP